MNRKRLRLARIIDVIASLPADGNNWLSTSEHARLQRLQIQSRRDQYLAGHWLARCLLADVHDGVARDWALTERPNLPPAIDGINAQLSISHSGDWIAAAVSDQAIGIDIEQRHPPRDALHRFEHLLLAEGDQAGSLNSDQLLQRWVAKEAWIKCRHGSALPDQLARLQLRPCALADADVEVRSGDTVHLAISMANLRTDTDALDSGMADRQPRTFWQIVSDQ